MRFFEEIANRESRNVNEIVLYPEGLFYKAYDRSAFACISRIPAFKPSKKRIKYCAREMASIGFPAAALPKYFPAAPRPLPDGRVVIALKDRIDADACQAWKMSLPLKERRPRGSSKAKAYVPMAGRGGGTLFVHPVDLLPDGPAAQTAGTTGPKQPAQATGGKGGVELPHLRQPAAPGPAMGPGGLAGGVPAGSPTHPMTGSDALRGLSTEPHAMREHPVQTTGGKGAADGSVGAMTPEALAAERTARQPMRSAAMVPGVAMGAHGDGPAESESGDVMGAIAAGSRALWPEAQAPQTRRAAKCPKWLARIAYKILGINELTYGTLPPAPKEGHRSRFETGAGQATLGTAMLPAERGESEAQMAIVPTERGESGAQTAMPARRHEELPARKATDPRRETREERVARLIREFRLEAATPVECLLFVADLKKEIDGYL